MTRTAALAVADLTVAFDTRHGRLRAVDTVSYEIAPGRTLGVVGESGCGKSVSALAVLGLVDPPGRIVSGRITVGGRRVDGLTDSAMAQVRGKAVAMIFQEPMTALNPVLTVGEQIAEGLRRHEGLSVKAARRRTLELIEQVGIAGAADRYGSYPHQLSGGMRQRVMIAMALACTPAVLIADEPTTALDVTVQAQILDLMAALQDETGTAIQLISHDLGVVSEIADDIAVMYAGRIVEKAPAARLFAAPAHPYTRGLLETIPRIGRRPDRLPSIKGAVPNLADLPSGCPFRTRCPIAGPDCAEIVPPPTTLAPDHEVRCIKAAP